MITLSEKLVFYIPHSQSLKEKRMVARSVMDKAKQKYNASIAEVGTQESHQVLTIGIAVVSGEHSHARNMMDEIIRFMERNADAELVEVVEY